ncbi:MAG: hypothetical protein ACOX69_07635 [Coriobacteriales bacterium]
MTLLPICVVPAYALNASDDAELPIYDTSWYTSHKNASTYTITNAKQLAGLARLVDVDGVTFEGKTIKLGADIDLSGVCGKEKGRTWLPIGWDNTAETGSSHISKWAFSGVFDGQGHKISHLYVDQRINSKIGAAALFGVVNNASLKNFSVSGKSVATSGGTAAGVAAYSSGTDFSNITSSVEVSVADDNSKAAAGYAGGIVAYVFDDAGDDTSRKFENLVNKGSVSGNCEYIGGIAGYLHMQSGTANIYCCSNEGEINGKETLYLDGASYAGGIVGSTGNENGSGNYSFSGCVNSGSVSGKGNATGGIVARLGGHSNTSVASSYNIGAVQGASSAGGVVGIVKNQDASITNTYNAGTLSGAQTSTGGIVGAADAGVSSSQFDWNYNLRGTGKAYSTAAEKAGLSNSGTSKTASDMRKSSFIESINTGVTDSGVKFEKTKSHPELSWQINGIGTSTGNTEDNKDNAADAGTAGTETGKSGTDSGTAEAGNGSAGDGGSASTEQGSSKSNNGFAVTGKSKDTDSLAASSATQTPNSSSQADASKDRQSDSQKASAAKGQKKAEKSKTSDSDEDKSVLSEVVMEEALDHQAIDAPFSLAVTIICILLSVLAVGIGFFYESGRFKRSRQRVKA